LRWLARLTGWPLVGRAIGRLAVRSLRKPLGDVTEPLPPPFIAPSETR
jgi:hypothetical protein